MISGKYLAMLGSMPASIALLVKEEIKLNRFEEPKRPIGYCLCGRRISTNKEQCLACKTKENHNAR